MGLIALFGFKEDENQSNNKTEKALNNSEILIKQADLIIKNDSIKYEKNIFISRAFK